MPVPFDNTYARLPDRFFSRVPPTPVEAPRLIRFNAELARHLGIGAEVFEGEQGAAIAAGSAVPEGAEPIALAYAGHQFGGFNPQLGDGRALLLGEVVDSDDVRWDLQLKGSGLTPYSRGGDGRSPLGPAVREYVISEAMAALGIPTTRTLTLASTGERVYRGELLPGGITLRVARSHVRVGTFEFFASRGDVEGLRTLVDYVLERHYPDLLAADNRALALLARVSERQAELIARWHQVGFIHGVMNTDNVLVCGDTIDFGPCAFMDAYDPKTVFSSIDRTGRYAYRNQPAIGQWNIACLARALIKLLDEREQSAIDAAQAVIDGFPARFEQALHTGMARKLGFSTEEPEDRDYVDGLLEGMHAAGADFTLSFRRLADLADPEGSAAHPAQTLTGLYEMPEALGPWLERWRARLERDPRSPQERAASMRAVSPALIPRNHRVEAAIRAAVDESDYAPFHALVDALAKPYAYDASLAHFATPPQPEEQVKETFCGT